MKDEEKAAEAARRQAYSGVAGPGEINQLLVSEKYKSFLLGVKWRDENPVDEELEITPEKLDELKKRYPLKLHWWR